MNERTYIVCFTEPIHLVCEVRCKTYVFLSWFSAVILKLMVNITSTFGSYRLSRISWHDIFSLSGDFPASWNLYIPHDLAELMSKINAHLLVNPIPKLTIVLFPKTPMCLKFGKTSNHAVENLPQRKLRVWAANNAHSHKNFITPNFNEHVLLWKQ